MSESRCCWSGSTFINAFHARSGSGPSCASFHPPQPSHTRQPRRLATVMATAKLPETHSGVVTSWVPITTAYPTVQGCDSLYWSVVANTVAAWDPGYGLNVADSSCLPRPATTWWNQGLLGENPQTKFSIGPITCPQAYYTARTSVKDSSSTLVGCCPMYDQLHPSPPRLSELELTLTLQRIHIF
jgi:hypothetical protein